jgi:hypothetical protein
MYPEEEEDISVKSSRKVRIWARSNRSDIYMGFSLSIYPYTHTQMCILIELVGFYFVFFRSLSTYTESS